MKDYNTYCSDYYHNHNYYSKTDNAFHLFVLIPNQLSCDKVTL